MMVQAQRRAALTAMAKELENASIEVHHTDQRSSAAHSRLRGQLGPIVFERGPGLWVAEGPVPVAVALDLYEDPLGRRDVRVNGDGECPAPEGKQVAWYTPEGARVYATELQAGYQYAREMWPHIFEQAGPITFHDDPRALGAKGYVELFHIGSAAGLELFTRLLRRHGVDRESRPPWWDHQHCEAIERNVT